MSPLDRRVSWRSRPQDPEHPFEAEVDGERWLIRLGDFPEEPLYTLLIDGEAVLTFDDWPATWRR